MKKLSLLLVITIFSVSMAQAQTPFRKGDKVVNVGLGLGTYGVSGKTTIPPMSVSFDYGVKNELFDKKSSLSVGGYAGFYSSKSSFTNSLLGEYGWKYTNILIGGRAAVHYDFIKKLDTYGGLMLGYDIESVSAYGNTGSYSANSAGGFIWSSFIGARYYFTPKIAGFLELGYGVSAIELGVAFKL